MKDSGKRRIILGLGLVLDFFLLPLVVPAGLLLRVVRRVGLQRLRFCRLALLRIGVLPVRNHYNEPFFDGRHSTLPWTHVRQLPGINWNLDFQLDLLSQFRFSDEILNLPFEKSSQREFYFGNSMYGPGDAEYLYNLIRLLKPRLIIEIGSGLSTLLAHKALEQNAHDDPDYAFRHVCIEPFHNDWLNDLGVTVLKKRSRK